MRKNLIAYRIVQSVKTPFQKIVSNAQGVGGVKVAPMNIRGYSAGYGKIVLSTLKLIVGSLNSTMKMILV